MRILWENRAADRRPLKSVSASCAVLLLSNALFEGPFEPKRQRLDIRSLDRRTTPDPQTGGASR